MIASQFAVHYSDPPSLQFQFRKIIKVHFLDISSNISIARPSFMFIVIMDIVSTAYYASKDAMKRLIDDSERTHDILGEVRDQMAQGFY